MFNTSPKTHFNSIVSDFRYALQILTFTGQKALSASFSFDLEQVSERPDLDIENLQLQVLEVRTPSDTRDRKHGDARKKSVRLTEGAAA